MTPREHAIREMMRAELDRVALSMLESGYPSIEDALVGSAEIAGMLGIRRENLSRWRRRHPDFPRPVFGDYPGGRPRWRRDEVIAWLSRPRGRGEGRS